MPYSVIKLIGAVIQQALVDLKDDGKNGWLIRRQAEKFIFTNELDDFLLYFHFEPTQAEYIRTLAKRYMLSNKSIVSLFGGTSEYVRSNDRALS